MRKLGIEEEKNGEENKQNKHEQGKIQRKWGQKYEVK